MTGTFHVDTAKLTTTANSFNSTATTVRTLTTSMMDTIDQLTGTVWSGDAQQKYTSQFKGLEDDINRMLNMINEHVEDLQKMAKAYETAEQTNTETASSLLSDVIS